MSKYRWQEAFDTADYLIALYRYLREKYPEHHDFYQRQVAIAMFNKQYAVIKLKEYEREYQREQALLEMSKG